MNLFSLRLGYALEDIFNLSCSMQPQTFPFSNNNLLYQVTSRYLGQERSTEKMEAEIDDINGVELDLPVGSVEDDNMLEVVIRAYDEYEGYDEFMVPVQVNITFFI